MNVSASIESPCAGGSSSMNTEWTGLIVKEWLRRGVSCPNDPSEDGPAVGLVCRCAGGRSLRRPSVSVIPALGFWLKVISPVHSGSSNPVRTHVTFPTPARSSISPIPRVSPVGRRFLTMYSASLLEIGSSMSSRGLETTDSAEALMSDGWGVGCVISGHSMRAYTHTV